MHLPTACRRSEVIFDLGALDQQIRQYDQTLSQKDFWEDQEKAQRLLRERARLEDELRRWEEKEKEIEEILILSDIAREGEDQEDMDELGRRVEALDKALDAYEIERMLGEENDKENAIVYINAGAGGTEAQDWAEMLLRMYLKWAEKKGFRVGGRRPPARRRGRGQERDVPP